MGYKIIKTERAERDLDRIVYYLVKSLGNPPAASALLDAIDKCYDELEDTPLIYERCSDPYLKAMGYRKAGIRNYIMVYKVDEESKTVTIMCFFHGSQDYEMLI